MSVDPENLVPSQTADTDAHANLRRRGGAKRTPGERERDLELTAGWYMRGWSQAAIAEQVGVSRPQISADIAEIRKRWRTSSIRDFDTAREIELAKIDRLEAIALDAWDRSIGEVEIRTTKSAGLQRGRSDSGELADEPEAEDPRGDELAEVETTVRTETKAGDPRFLERVAWCITRRCELLGLDAPKQQIHTAPDGGPIQHEIRGVVILVPAKLDLEEWKQQAENLRSLRS